MDATVSRKQAHVELCVQENVHFKKKATGFENYSFIHNALPELNYSAIKLDTLFLGKTIQFPLMISSMTGGYKDAENINASLSELCEHFQLPMGVGSQRQALEHEKYESTFSVVRKYAPTIPITANIGASEIRNIQSISPIRRIIDMVEADAVTIHINPLQELMQPEGTTEFSGVLDGIAFIVNHAQVPVIVKEVGAGISYDVAKRLLDVGVQVIDVAGAGGTSWAGVEILRSEPQADNSFFWDWGIPTAECLAMIRPLKEETNFILVSSGGITSGIDMACSLALGADICSSARPLLTSLVNEGEKGLENTINTWVETLKKIMFLIGAHDIHSLQRTHNFVKKS